MDFFLKQMFGSSAFSTAGYDSTSLFSLIQTLVHLDFFEHRETQGTFTNMCCVEQKHCPSFSSQNVNICNGVQRHTEEQVHSRLPQRAC